MTDMATTTPLGSLARQEMRNYAKHWLFWIPALLTLGLEFVNVIGKNFDAHPNSSSALDGLMPGALLGVLGLVVMMILTRRSDRAAAAAGAVTITERQRTLALAGAVVVPFLTALVWWVMAAYAYTAYPPDPETVPAGVPDSFIFAVMFGQGVMAAVGGPLLGLLLARWMRFRGLAAIASVLLVFLTIMFQGNFETGRQFRVLWVWTHFYGPVGWTGDHYTIMLGSPYWWVLYLAVLCALGVLVAMYHDVSQERSRLRNVILGLLAVAVILAVLTVTGGYDHEIVNPTAYLGV